MTFLDLNSFVLINQIKNIKLYTKTSKNRHVALCGSHKVLVTVNYERGIE